jgi:hypothetical protein
MTYLTTDRYTPYSVDNIEQVQAESKPVTTKSISVQTEFIPAPTKPQTSTKTTTTTTTPQTMGDAAARLSMPSCNLHSTPKFSENDACELNQYFKELEHLSMINNICDNQMRKTYTHRYVDTLTAEEWGSIAEYGPTHMWASFKQAILKLYPGATGD